MCDPSPKAECVPAFARESKRGLFVREAEKRDERWSEMELLLMMVVHREPGNVCIYKRGGIKGCKCGDRSIFTGSSRPRCDRGREGPCFAVCAAVCDPSPKAECVHTFARESKRGAFVREVENRDKKRFEAALWR